ncbi:hypothetical protein H7R39_03425 [Campylobacter sp. Marseille-Q3452]|uniref:Uncharacterized protein n=1 Tax=Campylobacter massiliensis TaxID=2762557 RepID=A0A842JB61_9BACT|nr:hypothetical protein [Campylobacter massiliensis]MBC2882324.1 hypothetical protein [Campylobacter massiliensis]
MSHNHETVSKQKHPTSKLVRACNTVAIALYVIIVGGFYLYIGRNVDVQYDYYEKPFVFCLPYIIWFATTLAMIYAALVCEKLKNAPNSDKSVAQNR